jgi:hypothetical protein
MLFWQFEKCSLRITLQYREWIVHSAFLEALERLLFQRFLKENSIAIPDYFYDACIDPIASCAVITENVSSLYSEYQAFKEEARNGALGKTAEFWIQFYMDLMECQRTAHLAVQENYFDQWLLAWNFFLPMYFALNKQNYARCASYYVGALQNIDILHPGLREMLDKSGVSLQAQDLHPLRTATDQRGEQTINPDTKTAGGIKSFANDSNAILKWTLNRSEGAKKKVKRFEMAGMSFSNEVYKSLRPSEILKSESYTTSVFYHVKQGIFKSIRCGTTVDTSFLYNLSSGTPIEEEISEEILNNRIEGEALFETFITDRILRKEILFHDLIKKRKLILFKASSKKVSLTRSTVVKTVEVNREILGTLLALTAKTEKVINFENALEYPLCSVPLSLACPGGTPRKTAKSKLLDVLRKRCRLPLTHLRENQPQKGSVAAFIIDLMANIRMITGIPETYEDLTWVFINTISTGYTRIDIVADTYPENSIKAAEHCRRGSTFKRDYNSITPIKVPERFLWFLTKWKE